MKVFSKDKFIEDINTMGFTDDQRDWILNMRWINIADGVEVQKLIIENGLGIDEAWTKEIDG